MKVLSFEVKGSSPDPYNVRFSVDGDEFRAACDCPAGAKRQYCKHRLEIMKGRFGAIVSENAESAKEIQQWLIGTDTHSALEAVGAAELILQESKKALAAEKKNLAAIMTGRNDQK